KVHIHANAVSLPSDIPTSVPVPAGTRNVTVNSAADVAAIGSWATVRDLTVNGGNITVTVPPGNYREFTVNGSCHLSFANGTYNLQNKFNVNGSSSILVSGNIVINCGQSMTFNGGSVLTLDPGTGASTVKVNV